MNKYQKRKNKLKKYKRFISNMNETICNDKQYTNFLKFMRLCEITTLELIKELNSGDNYYKECRERLENILKVNPEISFKRYEESDEEFKQRIMKDLNSR